MEVLAEVNHANLIFPMSLTTWLLLYLCKIGIRYSGITKLDRIRNDQIRGTTKVVEISEKVHEFSLVVLICNEKR